jgi:hypothetical protein
MPSFTAFLGGRCDRLSALMAFFGDRCVCRQPAAPKTFFGGRCERRVEALKVFASSASRRSLTPPAEVPTRV